MEKEQLQTLNLVNETALTDYITRLFATGNVRLVQNNMHKVTNEDGRTGDHPTPEFIGRTREILTNTKNPDFIRGNKQDVAQMMAHGFMKKNIRKFINRYVNSEFLRPVEYSEELADNVKTSILEGSKVYYFDEQFVPSNIREELMGLIAEMGNQANEYVDTQLKNEAEFSFDMNSLHRSFDINKIFEKISKNKKLKIGIQKAQDLEPLQNPGIQMQMPGRGYDD
ncbi:hypothetical protein LJC18_01020 [Lachnospiraceae bacterium OttesenSCG-928-E19]|nr:hypothetical protein [Lachnospiraceae bacterium OttesenSCG-928-E19]